MRLAALLMCLLSLSACDSVGIAPATEAPPLGGSSVGTWSEMLDAVNAARAAGQTCGSDVMAPAPPLVWNARLTSAAARHSSDMAANGFMNHTGSDGSHAAERVTEAGYSWRIVGENIARYQRTVDEVVGDWVESPSHCRNLMDPRYAEMGAAEENRYWTQVFSLAR